MGDKKSALTVSAVLMRWQTSLGGEEQRLRGCVWNAMRGSMPAVVVSLTMMGMVLVGVAVRARGTIVSSLIDLVYAVSLFGCSMAQLFFAKKRTEARAMLGRLHAVATQFEGDLAGSNHSWERWQLGRSARAAHRWLVGMRAYATLAGLSVTLPHFATLKPVPAVWPHSPDLEAPLALAFAGTSLLCCVGYSEFLSLQLVATISTTGLYRALGARLQRAAGKELETLARLHGELNSTAGVLERLFAPFLPSYLTPPLTGTALATCGFLYGAFSSNFMSLVPQIFIIFMPLCLYGDSLQHASGELLSACAYSANWLLWPVSARRVMHYMMVRCTRPQVVSVKAFGHANRKACLSVLKTWFSFVQTLTNLSGIDAH